MKVLVVGSGGREHALVWKIAQSETVDKMYCAPGNGGISRDVECVNIKAEDIGGLIKFVKNNSIDITVVGPEIPLVNGIVDEFEKNGLKIFGPSKAAAQLEGSKAFSKKIMLKYKVPTALSEEFISSEAAMRYLEKQKYPLVVKADGLAAGKGVIICTDRDEAVRAIKTIMEDKVFGDSGAKIIIEEYLNGEEVSVLAFSDGKNVIPLVPSQDHKRIFDEDKGPNTGGMGAYSPLPVMNEKMLGEVKEKILLPVVLGMEKEGILYKGILYAGLMLTKDGPKVLEFNARFGDPETQAVLPRMESDIMEPIIGVIAGDISRCVIKWKTDACVCVVIASGGYPDRYEKGFEISGLNDVEDAVVFHAGTILEDGNILTSGGRVLGVTALGADIQNAIDKCYSAIEKLSFKNMHYRKDIGKKAVRRVK